MKYFISLLILLLFAWLGLWSYYSCNWCAKNIDEDPTIVKEKSKPDANALAKKAYEDSIAKTGKVTAGLVVKGMGNQELFSFSDNFRINQNNADVFIPDSLAEFKDHIIDYLGQYQNQELIISGYESLSEKENQSGFGLSRANTIKDILINSGVNPNRIVSKAYTNDFKYNSDGKYQGGILLNFKTLDTSRIEEIEKSVANRTLYSSFGQKTFKPDPMLVNYVLELKNYLSKYPNKKIQIIGHTDDIGEEEANLWYGQERAIHVKNYFISQGIKNNEIVVLSRGESSPLVPNNSEENRAKNRRIEITVN